ncbi:uncharacterized protein, partial [Symphalangus syndactylus]|uniref:uncharacterized protein n=1 Tax=Symphalangus syndactylus TaxID=9590 RepID=UPI003006EE49
STTPRRGPCSDRAPAAKERTLGSSWPGCGHGDAGPRTPTIGLRCLLSQPRQTAFGNGFPVGLGLEPPSKLQARDRRESTRKQGEHEEGAPLLAVRETTGQGAVPQRATSPERLCVASREPLHEVHRSPGSPRLGMVTWRSLETQGFRISFAMLPRDQGRRTQTQTENQETAWDSEPCLNPECPDRRLNHCRVCNDIALYKAQMWSLGEDDGHQWHPSSGLRPRISCPMCALPQKINFYVTFEPLYNLYQNTLMIGIPNLV